MKAIVVGGGKVGYYLVKTLTERKHKITLIEHDKDICDKVAEDFDKVDVICGDGTDLDVLKDADIENAEVVAAVTGKDEENLVICEVAKVNFDVNKTIARINNPKNRKLFKVLGVDKTVCSTDVIANLIEWELENEKLKIVQTFDRGEMVLVEAMIDNKAKWKNQIISELKIPEECVIVSIFREEKVIYPKGRTVIRENDRVIIVTNTERIGFLEKSIFGA